MLNIFRRPATQAAKDNHPSACYKGFYTHVEACTVWYKWVHDGTLPETLRGRYNSVPPLLPPEYDDLEIAGRHRLPEHCLPEIVDNPGEVFERSDAHGDSDSEMTLNPGVTLRVHATATVHRSPRTPASASHRVPTVAPSTPTRGSRAPVASTSHLRPQGRVPAPPVAPQTQLNLSLDESEDRPEYWVIISGKRPGVYRD